MGWLEVLSQLQRLVPLMTRLAPVLESYVGARGAAALDSKATQDALARMANELKGNAEIATADQAQLREALQQQHAQMTAINDELHQIGLAQEQAARHVSELNIQITEVASSLKIVTALLVVLLLLCVGILAFLLLHHA
jgi:chromosome segregation ATPase